MKKLFLIAATLLLSLLTSLKADAQVIQTALLQHDETVRSFTGTSALKNALAAAEDGDLITLSGGSFDGATVEKAVRIQGAGYKQSPNGDLPTQITSTLYLKVPEESGSLFMEGLYLKALYLSQNLYNALIRGCSISSISYHNEKYYINCGFINCKIYNDCNNIKSKGSVFDHCYLGSSYYSREGDSTFLRNCYMWQLGGSLSDYTSVCENCIIYKIYAESTCQLKNCVYNTITSNSNPTRFGCYYVNSDLWGSVVKNGYITEEYADTYLGLDGTPVGLGGGEHPFTDIPSNPRITSVEVPTETDADGKLKVAITVEVQK